MALAGREQRLDIIRQDVGDIAAQVRGHEQKVEGLYHLIGRDPSRARTLGGTLLSKAHQAIADVDSLGAFAVAE